MKFLTVPRSASLIAGLVCDARDSDDTDGQGEWIEGGKTGKTGSGEEARGRESKRKPEEGAVIAESYPNPR